MVNSPTQYSTKLMQKQHESIFRRQGNHKSIYQVLSVMVVTTTLEALAVDNAQSYLQGLACGAATESPLEMPASLKGVPGSGACSSASEPASCR